MPTMTQTPDFLTNSQGHLVPLTLIKPIDQTRHAVVMALSAQALTMQQQLQAFKKATEDEFTAFVALSFEQFGLTVGGSKGNITLLSFDGKFKIVRQMQDSITFDERLQAAKALLDQCIAGWSLGANPKLKALVDDAFQVNQEGRINTSRVLGLKRLDIADEDWHAAMNAIHQSVTRTFSKSYTRFYQRVGNSEQWQAISLDFANL